MKTRNGFISNSSSSSFIIFGANLNEHPELKEKYVDINNYELKELAGIPTGTELRGTDDTTYIGMCLGGGSTDDGDFGVKKKNIHELTKYANAFRGFFGVEPHLYGEATY